MNAQDVDQPSTGLTPVTLWSPEVVTPLVASEWSCALQAANLLSRYPYIPPFISHGADAGIPTITATFTPPNHPSIALHEDIFLEIIENKFKKCRYWGLYSKADIEDIIRLFQTSPLSLIPKPGRPGKCCLIQNLSYPLISKEVRSINSSIATDLYPCTWGTFATVATLIWLLPPGSLGASRNVAKAYRIVPLTQNNGLALLLDSKVMSRTSCLPSILVYALERSHQVVCLNCSVTLC